ncbi:hypothetical protein NQZ68_008081 [Dissostichus eleginoides]|nr:hypothetical protein NQZ68_008081 [Dissostichus eleginoides]
MSGANLPCASACLYTAVTTPGECTLSKFDWGIAGEQWRRHREQEICIWRGESTAARLGGSGSGDKNDGRDG